ncbi:MAG: NAD(P)H-hydrate dehydratase [Firmicutes bacterium]|nr:NAD(P)H-hydrate dehydratase [Bacillota bacterium]
MKDSIITKEFVQTIIGKRDREIHKGDCGRILIVAGSTGMAGAAILAARAALRCGSGLVQVAIPKDLFPIVQVGVPEATCLERDFESIDLSLYDAVAVGPGIGQSKDSIDSVKYILENYDGPIVLDADGLNVVAYNDLFMQLREKKNVIITPHIGEARRLLAVNTDGMERKEIALELVKKTNAVSVLKGHATVVAVGDSKTYINTTGNPGMATAGSGDVLTGIIASLLGQRKTGLKTPITPEDAALAGVFIHGMAGDLAAEAIGEYGLIATDISYYTAIAIKEILG